MVGGGWLAIFPSPKAYIGGGTTSESYCCKLTRRVWSLYGGEKRVTPRQQAVIEGRGSSKF